MKYYRSPFGYVFFQVFLVVPLMGLIIYFTDPPEVFSKVLPMSTIFLFGNVCFLHFVLVSKITETGIQNFLWKDLTSVKVTSNVFHFIFIELYFKEVTLKLPFDPQNVHLLSNAIGEYTEIELNSDVDNLLNFFNR